MVGWKIPYLLCFPLWIHYICLCAACIEVDTNPSCFIIHPNPSNPSAGYRVTLFTKLHLDFLGPIIIPTLPEYFPNFCCQTILFWYLWILNTNLNIQKIICILNTNVVCRVRRAAAEKYYDELLILEECCCVKTE